MADICDIELKKLFGDDKFTPEDLRQFRDEIDAMLKRIQTDDRAQNVSEQLRKAMEARAEEIEIAALKDKANKIINEQRRMEAVEFINREYSDAPEEGLLALLGHSKAFRKGARMGVSGEIEALSNTYRGDLHADLVGAQLDGYLAKEANQKDIYIAMSKLNSRGVDKQQLLKTMPRETVDVAEILNRHLERARIDANEAGANIGKRDGFALSRTHDSDKIATAAGKLMTDVEANREAWIDFVYDKLDFAKTFPEVAPENRRKALAEVFTELTEKGTSAIKEAAPSTTRGTKNIGKSLSHHRVLNFKTPELDYEYYAKFGNDDPIGETVMRGLEHMAQSTGLMRRLGTNPKDNFNRIVASVAKAQAGKGTKASDSLKSTVNYINDKVWPVLDNSIAQPSNQSVAKFFQAFRSIKMLGQLGAATISGLADIPNRAAAMTYLGSKSFTKNVQKAIADQFKGVTGGKRTAEEIRLAAKLGIMLDSVNNVHQKFSVGEVRAPGGLAKATNMMFRYNGMTRWQDSIRFGAAAQQAVDFGMHASRAFDDLPEGLQRSLKLFNIEPEEWDVLRSAQFFEHEDYGKLLIPDAVKDLPDTVFEKVLQKQGKKVTPNNIKLARERLRSKGTTMFREAGRIAATEQSLMDKAMILQGTKPGSPEGEFVRSVMQYKSFMVSMLNEHVGRGLHGYDFEKVSTAKALQRMFSGGNNKGLQALSKQIAWGIPFGYAALTLKDLVKGRKPRDPEDPAGYAKLIAASMAQAGALGIYGDFLFGEANRYGGGFIATALGPTAGTAEDVISLYHRVRDGDPAAAKAFNLLIQNTPGVNTLSSLPQTKAIFDYLILHRMREYMNPGYLRRMERRLKKQNDQEFFFPPSEVIPRGGF